MLPKIDIEKYIYLFINHAKEYYNMTFLVTKIGCGLAGYTPEEIAPLFKDALTVKNICLPEDFFRILLGD